MPLPYSSVKECAFKCCDEESTVTASCPGRNSNKSDYTERELRCCSEKGGCKGDFNKVFQSSINERNLHLRKWKRDYAKQNKVFHFSTESLLVCFLFGLSVWVVKSQ